MHSLIIECSIRVRVIALLEYIDLFLLNVSNSFQNASIIPEF